MFGRDQTHLTLVLVIQQKSPVIGPAAPSLDLGNDISALNAAPSYGGISPQEPSSSQHLAAAQGPLATQMAQLSVIAERPGGSAEETDDDDDDDWNPMEGRSLEELNTLNDECTAKEGYLYKKGERRKVCARCPRKVHHRPCTFSPLTRILFSADVEEALVRPTTDTTLVLQDQQGVQTASPAASVRGSLRYPSHSQEARPRVWHRHPDTHILRPSGVRS